MSVADVTFTSTAIARTEGLAGMDKLNDVSGRFEVDPATDNRTASLSEVADKLRDCLEELDRLQVWRVGAHVSQAISDLEVEICGSL
jgi:hypothetical protein